MEMINRPGHGNRTDPSGNVTLCVRLLMCSGLVYLAYRVMQSPFPY